MDVAGGFDRPFSSSQTENEMDVDLTIRNPQSAIRNVVLIPLIGILLCATLRAELRREIQVYSDRVVVHSDQRLEAGRTIRASVYTFIDDVVPLQLELQGHPEVDEFHIALRLRQPLSEPSSAASARRYHVRLAGVRYAGAQQSADPFDGSGLYLPNRLKVSRSSDSSRRDALTLEVTNRRPEELGWLRQVTPRQVVLEIKEGDQNWSPLPVRAVEALPQVPDGYRGLQTSLAGALPRGRELIVRAQITPGGSLPTLVGPATRMKFEIPGVDLAWLTAELALISARRTVSRDYDSEFLLDLVLAPRLRQWAPEEASYYLRFAPRFRAAIGSDDPEHSESPNSMVASVGLELGHWLGGAVLSEYVSRLDVRLESDRDFDQRNVVSGIETRLFFKHLVRRAEYQQERCQEPGMPLCAALRFWYVVPRAGYDAGGSSGTRSARTVGNSAVARFKSGLEVAAGVGPLVFRFDNGYWWLHNEPLRRHRHYLEAAVELPLGILWSGKHGLAWKFRRGEQPPFASRTDVFSLSYQLRY